MAWAEVREQKKEKKSRERDKESREKGRKSERGKKINRAIRIAYKRVEDTILKVRDGKGTKKERLPAQPQRMVFHGLLIFGVKTKKRDGSQSIQGRPPEKLSQELLLLLIISFQNEPIKSMGRLAFL